MKYPYVVVRNGIKYRAGEEVPENDVKEITEEPVIEEPPVEVEATDEPEVEADEPIADPEPKTEYKPVPQYNKNTINRMSVADLRTVARESGIENVVEKTGAQLKRELIELFGL